MPILGAHMSIAGGFHKAVERAVEAGCECLQIFTKNNNQWAAKPIAPDEASRFREAVRESPLQATLSHASYLINMASPDTALFEKSVAAMGVELERATQLGIPWVVVHPGSYTTSSESEGILRIADGIRRLERSSGDSTAGILLENTAGQGSNLGWDFAHLARIIDEVGGIDRTLGVCLDTCHALAAGYALDRPGGWSNMLASIRDTFGFDRIHALHLNDSKRPCGSRVDRHEHIGLGHVTLDGFRRVLRSRKLGHLPMYLETPKEAVEPDRELPEFSPDNAPHGGDPEEAGDSAGDRRNLRVLRTLIRGRQRG